MEEKNNSMSELVKLMHKTGKAMEMTREKQSSIDTLKSNIMEEVRPMMVEKMKEDIKLSENGKKEFDEMTKNAMIEAKTSILQIRETSEKEYQEKLVQFLQKQKSIEEKLASIKSKELPDEKMKMAERTAKSALDKAKNEMKEFQNKHFTKRAKLNEFEKSINNWAIEIGVEKELNNVQLNKEQTNAEPTNEEPTNAEPTNEEPTNEEPTNAEPTNAEPTNEEPTNAEPTNAEPTNAEPTNAEPTNAEPTNEEPTKVEPTNAGSTNPANKEDKKKLKRVEVKGKTYTFVYKEGKEEVKETAEKMGVFKALFEKTKFAFTNKNDYGITFKQAWKADINIIKNVPEEEKEMYLTYMAEQGEGDCFTIDYENKKGKQAKRLEAVNDKWVKKLESGMKADELFGKIKKDVDIRKAEFAQVISDSKRHTERQEALNKIFGEGFDQHENPPQPSNTEKDSTQEEVAKNVNEIMNENSER